jgi:hypothetical protein
MKDAGPLHHGRVSHPVVERVDIEREMKMTDEIDVSHDQENPKARPSHVR